MNDQRNDTTVRQDGLSACVFGGKAEDLLPGFPDALADAVATDPPYGLADLKPALVTGAITEWVTGNRWFVPDGRGFMSRDWDRFVPPPGIWDECYRILKPGGYLLAFAAPRTADLMGLSIRLAGFEIRDSLHWLYGTGLPKSLDVSKAIDTRWKGWETALKPAHEPIILARKPLTGTVAGNVLEWGTGALNIDGCRVHSGPSKGGSISGATALGQGSGWNAHNNRPTKIDRSMAAGRWPTNLLLTHCADCNGGCAPDCPVAGIDAQSGITRSSGGSGAKSGMANGSLYEGGFKPHLGANAGGLGDTGGASRFYPQFSWSAEYDLPFLYQAKAPASERPVLPDGTRHPTCKPLALMRWLVRLVTPPDGLVLDPFCGTGTTVQAALEEGFRATGIDDWPAAIEMCRIRLARYENAAVSGAEVTA